MPLLIWAGFWQLSRAEEKTTQQAHWETLAPQQWLSLLEQAEEPGQPIEGQPVIIEGRYLPGRQWLLDNRTRDGQAGYEVLTLFQPAGSPPVVINRGWIAGSQDRTQLPDVTVGTDRHPLQARVAAWPVPPVIGAVQRQAGWPKRVQSLTRERAAETSGEAVSPVFLRLADQQQPGALAADWAPARMGASTHYGYAVQWFGLAIVLAILSIVASFRKKRSIDSSHD